MQFFIALHLAVEPVDLAFELLQVGQHQFGVDHLDVIARVDGTGNMNDIVIFKTTHHMDNRRGLANVGEKLVAQPFAQAGPFDQPGNVKELDGGVDHLFRLHQFGQFVDARVGQRHNRLVGFDGAKWIICCFRVLGFCQGIKRGALAHIGQPHNADT